MLSFVVFKAQWQIICFDKNNEQSSKMIRQGGDRNWQGRLKNMQGLKKKKLAGLQDTKHRRETPLS